MLNHDESTYITIAGELLRGEVYLKDVIDTKPIGIFWLYAGWIYAFGRSIFGLRLLATLAVALSSFGLYQASRRALLNERAGVAAGLIYLLVCSVFSDYGLNPNTELFFNALTIAAVALAVAPRIGRPDSRHAFWHWPVAGLLLGLGFIVKPFVAAEALAIGLFALYHYFSRSRYARGLAAGTLLVTGFCLPILGVVYYYYQLNLLDVLTYYSVGVNGRYPVDLPWYLGLKYMADFALRSSPFIILGAMALVQSKGRKSSEIKRWSYYLLLQTLTVAAVILLTGKRFGHYQIQLQPIVAAFGALWWVSSRGTEKGVERPIGNRWYHSYKPALIIAISVMIGGMHAIRYAEKYDREAAMVRYLETHLGPNETFVNVSGGQIAYFVLDRDVPTPFVHSSLLFYPHHLYAFQIDPIEEARHILNNPNVTYVTAEIEAEEWEAPYAAQLKPYFSPVDTVDDRLVFWRRR